MNWRPVFDAGPWEWAAAGAALVAFAALWPFFRPLPKSLKILRASAFLLLALCLLKPSLDSLEERGELPRLAIALDLGPSMAAVDDHGRPRLARAAAWLKARRAELERRAQVSLHGVSAQARRLSWEDLDKLSPSASALDPQALAEASEAAAGGRMWLLSDGAFAADGAPLPSAVPIDALGVGPKKSEPAVGVAAVEAPDFVFLHGRFSLTAALEAAELSGGSVRAALSGGGRELGAVRLPVERPYELLSATFTVEASALGRQEYLLSLAGEDAQGRTIARAERRLRVEVIRQKHRIMYLAGRPSFEYAHLRAQLKSDPNHELVSFVILRNPDNLSPVPDSELSLIPFPASEIFESSLSQFDLFILENFAYWRFNLPPVYLENLRRFIQNGGAMLVIGGSNAFSRGGYQGTPLEAALPVDLLPPGQGEDFQPGLFAPEPAGAEHPLLNLGETPEESARLWRQLPALDGFSRFAAVKPGTSALLRHPSVKTASGQPLPLLAVREFGRGKVMLLGTGSTWRWKLAGGGDWRFSSFYTRFWSRAVQYLTGTLDLKRVRFAPLPERLPPREPATVALRLFDEDFRPLPGSQAELSVLWTGPDGRPRPAPAFEREPGVFAVELTGLSEGRHALRATARRAGRLWGEDQTEFLWKPARGEAPLDRRRLKALAEAAGGRYADLGREEDWVRALPPARNVTVVSRRRALWPSSGWLWALCALLCAEWLLRRRRGWL